MKKALLLLTILGVFSLTSACSAIQGVVSPGGVASTGATTPGGSPDQNMPLAMKLALGILKLEDTSYPLTAQQAETMLPLWKALRSLGDSQTTAAEELTAVVNQIYNTLTPEQIAAINAMGITYQDMEAIAQERGLQLGRGRGFGSMSPEARATMQAARQSGQAPPGGPFGGEPPMGGPGGPGGGNVVSPSVRQTAAANRGTSFNNSRVGIPAPLLEAIIKFLQERAG